MTISYKGTNNLIRQFKESDPHKKFEADPKKHPNLGRAPGKNPRNTKTTPSRPEKNANISQSKEAGERRCYICNQPDHLANACPSKGKIKAGAQNSLYKNKSFMALWQSSFADQEQQQCATHSPPQIMGRRLVPYVHGRTFV